VTFGSDWGRYAAGSVALAVEEGSRLGFAISLTQPFGGEFVRIIATEPDGVVSTPSDSECPFTVLQPLSLRGLDLRDVLGADTVLTHIGRA